MRRRTQELHREVLSGVTEQGFGPAPLEGDMADKQSELNELKRFGANPQKNSGRGKHAKGDGIVDELFMIDVKEYEKSFSITQDVWAKTCTDAYRAGGKEPMLGIVLGSGNNKVRLVVISKTMFEDMKTAYLREQGMV